jgi:hypothetical protein
LPLSLVGALGGATTVGGGAVGAAKLTAGSTAWTAAGGLIAALKAASVGRVCSSPTL